MSNHFALAEGTVGKDFATKEALLSQAITTLEEGEDLLFSFPVPDSPESISIKYGHLQMSSMGDGIDWSLYGKNHFLAEDEDLIDGGIMDCEIASSGDYLVANAIENAIDEILETGHYIHALPLSAEEVAKHLLVRATPYEFDDSGNLLIDRDVGNREVLSGSSFVSTVSLVEQDGRQKYSIPNIYDEESFLKVLDLVDPVEVSISLNIRADMKDRNIFGVDQKIFEEWRAEASSILGSKDNTTTKTAVQEAFLSADVQSRVYIYTPASAPEEELSVGNSLKR